MPSLIDIRRRIRSFRNTQQITKAMKMVSVAKLRRAQERMQAARPYSSSLQQMLANVVAAASVSADLTDSPLLTVREEKRVQLILVSTDGGLVGAFNANVFKGVQRYMAEHPTQEISLETVGRKGRDFFRRRGAVISGELLHIFQKAPRYENALEVANRVIDRYRKGEVDAVYIVFNEFKNVASQNLTVNRILPVPPPENATTVDYIFEQPPAEMLESLLPRYIESQIYRAFIESSASEHAARMTAMEAATKNSGEIINRLTLHMNRVRQAAITKEIIEVVSGAAAVD